MIIFKIRGSFFSFIFDIENFEFVSGIIIPTLDGSVSYFYLFEVSLYIFEFFKLKGVFQLNFLLYPELYFELECSLLRGRFS